MELYSLFFFVVLIFFFYKTVKKSIPHQLQVFRVHSSQVDSVLFGELWIIRRAYWPQDTIEHYAKKIKKANCTFVLLRDTNDGSIRGIFIETVHDGEIDGKKYRALYLGNTFMYTYYRGSITIALTMLKSFFLHWWNTPRGIIPYIVFCAATYKPYLVAAHSYPDLYPTIRNHNSMKAKTFKSVISEVMSKIYPKYWDPDLFKLKMPVESLDLAPIKDEYLIDPDINFFKERNPNYMKGECMACIFPVTGLSLLRTIVTVILRTGLFPKKTGKKRDVISIVQRDIARTWMQPKETNLYRTFNLSVHRHNKERHNKEKQDKRRLRKMVQNFGKGDDLIHTEETTETKQVQEEGIENEQENELPTDLFKSRVENAF